MKWPPYLLHIAVHGTEHRFSLWIPLCIIGPIFLVFVLAVFLVLLPFLLLSLIFTWEAPWWRWFWYGVPAFFSVLCSTPGLQVDIEDRGKRIYITVV